MTIGLAGCGTQTPAAATPAPLSIKRQAPELRARVSALNLNWALSLSPTSIRKHTPVDKAFERLVTSPRFARLRRQTGLDLAQLEQVVVAEYDFGHATSLALLARHRQNASELERHITAALPRPLQAEQHATGMRRVWGPYGDQEAPCFVTLGAHLAGYEFGLNGYRFSDMRRSFCRTAVMLHLQRPNQPPTLASVLRRHHVSAPPPHDGELAIVGPFEPAAVHGLLAGASLVTVTADIANDGRTLNLVLTLHGAFDQSALPDRRRALADLIESDTGERLGRSAIVTPARMTVSPEGNLVITIGAQPEAFLHGLVELAIDNADAMLP